MSLFFPTIQENKNSDDRRKRLLTIGAIVLLTAVIVFIISYWITPDPMPWWVYAGAMVVPLVTFVLIRFNQITAASYFFVPALNLIVYLVMSSEPIRTAFHLHMITAAFVALNLFGYKHRFAGIAFSLFSFGLGLLSYAQDFSVLEFRNYSDFEIKFFFIINTVLFIFASIYLLISMLQWNFSTEMFIMHKKAQAALKNDQISKTNSELDRFVFKISHDLRAPLNTLAGLANLAGSDGKRQLEYFQKMKNEILVMERFIREVADYSKNARLELEQKPIALRKLIEEVTQSINHLNDFNRIAIEIEVDESIQIESDELRLKIVFGNLLTNAIKYHDPTKANPSIKIIATVADSVKISITDNGIGIAEDHYPRIFDMFYKGSYRSKGSGLGLYMVQETLRKLNGTIDFHSTLHTGTTFTVTIPISAK